MIDKRDLRPRLEIGMSRKAEPLLLEMQARYGGRVRREDRGGNRAHISRWVVYGRELESLLARVGLHLRLKTELGLLVMEACAIHTALPARANGSRSWTLDAKEQTNALRLRMMALNRKGPMLTNAPPAGGIWRTNRTTFEEPFGEPFSATWPRSAMTWRGTAYQLQPSAPRTAATGSSPLLATPRARDGSRPSPRTSSDGYGATVEQQMLKMLPTPHGFAKEGQDRKPGPTGNEPGRALTLLPTPMARSQSGTQVSGESRTGGPMLEEAVKLLPTPVAGDGREKGGGGRWSPTSAPLEQTIKDEVLPSSGATTSPPSPAGKPSTAPRLNPSFVGWMMGTPSCGECGREWTDPDCPHSATAFTSTSAG